MIFRWHRCDFVQYQTNKISQQNKEIDKHKHHKDAWILLQNRKPCTKEWKKEEMSGNNMCCEMWSRTKKACAHAQAIETKVDRQPSMFEFDSSLKTDWHLQLWVLLFTRCSDLFSKSHPWNNCSAPKNVELKKRWSTLIKPCISTEP